MTVAAGEQDLTVVLRTAEIDLTSAQVFGRELNAAVEEVSRQDAAQLTLDCREVLYIDSGGISTLLDAQKRLGDEGRRLRMVNVQRTVHRALDVLGLLEPFGVQ